MCGIAGLFLRDGKTVDPRLWSRVDRLLHHRGPDDIGVLAWSPGGTPSIGRDPALVEGHRLALLHRRLSILELSERGWQPMQSRGGRFSLVFNGEIYNYIELRSELESKGYEFSSHSDTEVLLAAYVEWGSKCLQRFVGMFAFAILNLETQRLFLARDHFGIKPLYFCHSSFGFGFASEIPVLLEFPGVSRSVCPERLFDYLRFGLTDHGDRTMFRDVMQIPTGSSLEFVLNGTNPSPQIHQFWSPPSYSPSDISFGEAKNKLRALFLESVDHHMRSDVPVGCCLSGGIDSSAITMAAAKSASQLKTFTFISSDENKSEANWAAMVAAAAGTKSHQVSPGAADLVNSLSDLVGTQGEPFTTTSIFAQYKVFELVGQNGIKVVLDGQGADELLGGYASFVGARGASLLRSGKLGAAIKLIRGASSMGGVTSFSLAARSTSHILPESMHAIGRRLVGRDLVPSWINQDYFRSSMPQFRVPWQSSGPNYLQGQLREAVSTSSLPMLLRFEDRNSMRFSIESRVPFLTSGLADFLLSLPEEYLIDNTGGRKTVFRAAMRGIVPDSILDRRDKVGFETPEVAWMRELTPWIETNLSSDVARTLKGVNMDLIRADWEKQHARGSTSMWRCLNTIEWVRQFDVTFS